MKKELYKIISPKLRKCQNQSIESIFEYLDNPTEGKSCLTSLPTGGGKTGVIASVCLLSDKQKILVLSHRSPVRDQLIKELGGDFFKKILKDELNFDYLPSYKLDSEWKNEGIYVSTFQKLGTLDPETLNNLIESIDLLFIDEGHAEPAKEWSKIARSFTCPKVIITATPYRNDLFQFNINTDYGFIYTFKEALEDEILSPPVFENISKEKLIKRIKQLLNDQPNTKCIIKCNTGNDVEEYRQMMSEHFKTAAFHDRYNGQDKIPDTSNKVPKSLSKSDYQVIIHQKKLDEGVDIPQAKILVLTYPVSSGRELVQTIGRVVRLFNRCTSYVLDMSNESNQKVWGNYREFDRYLSNISNWKKFLKSLNTAELINSYLENFPDHSYYDSGFKKKFNIQNFDISRDLVIPLASICFVSKLGNFSIPSFCSRLELERVFNGELVRHILNCEGFDAFVSIKFNNSKYLNSHLFFEPSLEITLVKDIGDFIAIFDSRAIDYSRNSNFGTGPAVSTHEILKLCATSDKTRTKEIHTRAISSTRRKPEGVSLLGKNLDEVIHSQANSSSKITRLKVDNLDSEQHIQSSYYIGTKSGRIADQKQRNFSLNDISDWINEVSMILKSNIKVKSELINSYAQSVEITPVNDPISILIDLSWLEVHEEINTHQLENGFKYFEYKNGFYLFDKNKNEKITIEYNEEKGILELKSKSNFIMKETGLDLLKELNENQDFKILYDDGISYLDGQFFQHYLPTHEGIELDSTKKGKFIIALEQLQKKGLDEKGVLKNSGEFDRNAIFYLIDQLSKISIANVTTAELGKFYSHIPEVKLIVCTDMGIEPADFIIASDNKICFVHIKCGTSATRPKSSAGSIAEVGGQAIKNLEHLISKSRNLKIPNLAELYSAWPRSNALVTLNERVRLIDGISPDEYKKRHKIDSKKLMDDAIEKIINLRVKDSVEKEIWIVVGNSFSRKHFINNLKKGKDSSSTSLQAYQLIDSWLSTTDSNDVSLKIFVSP